jgi:hypothetical protein
MNPPTRTLPSRNGQGVRGRSVFDRIAPIEISVKGIKLCLYGRGKTGKTRLACTFPKPLLIIGTEDGTKSVANVGGVDDGRRFVRAYSSEEFGELVEMLREGKYATVVVDTAGGLQDVIVKEVLGLAEMPVQKSWGMAHKQDWGIIGSQLKERLNKLLALAEPDRDGGNREQMDVVIIAHERTFEVEDVPADLILPTVGAALSPATATWLNGACDYIGQCFIREEKKPMKVKVAGKEKIVTKSTGKGEYCMRVDTHPVYLTGFRVPEGTVLPDAIVNPHYEKIAALIRGDMETACNRLPITSSPLGAVPAANKSGVSSPARPKK